MLSISLLLTLVVYLIVAGVVCWLIWWLIDYCGLPEPFNKVAHILVAVVAVLVVIGVLLQLLGGAQVFRM